MDNIDRKIIGLLALDARRALADIGNSVGLSASSVNERIRRMVQAGIIRRFTVDVDPASLNLGTVVFIWVALREDADEKAFHDFIAASDGIQECHHVTGQWSYVLKLRVGDVSGIEAFLTRMKQNRFLGRSETMLALSSPLEGVTIPAEIT